MDFGDDHHRYATIGSRVGALTLGTPVFDGLVAHRLVFVV
jgi:ABC-type proline/glycine betaine transport system permease subunit